MKWISVEDRLPEYGKQVLFIGMYHGEYHYLKPFICFGNRNCTNSLGEVFIWNETKFYSNADTFPKVTHWQPLPELPEIKGE